MARKELTFMEAVEEAKKGDKPVLNVEITSCGIKKFQLFIDDEIIKTRCLDEDECEHHIELSDIEGKWYLDEEESLSDKINPCCNCDNELKVEDVKEAIADMEDKIGNLKSLDTNQKREIMCIINSRVGERLK